MAPIELYLGVKDLDYDPLTRLNKLKAEHPLKLHVGQYVLVLTDKNRFAKEDKENLVIYLIRPIQRRWIYLTELKLTGDQLEEKNIRHAFKPYEIQPISEDTVKFILSREPYHISAKNWKEVLKAKEGYHRASNREYMRRRRSRNNIDKLMVVGDYETAAQLEAELAKIYRKAPKK